MITTNHTPGSWHVAGLDSDQVWSAHLAWVADCAPDGAGMPYVQGNAHLIAAAPDLLAVCQWICDYPKGRIPVEEVDRLLTRVAK